MKEALKKKKINNRLLREAPGCSGPVTALGTVSLPPAGPPRGSPPAPPSTSARHEAHFWAAADRKLSCAHVQHRRSPPAAGAGPPAAPQRPRAPRAPDPGPTGRGRRKRAAGPPAPRGEARRGRGQARREGGPGVRGRGAPAAHHPARRRAPSPQLLRRLPEARPPPPARYGTSEGPS